MDYKFYHKNKWPFKRRGPFTVCVTLMAVSMLISLAAWRYGHGLLTLFRDVDFQIWARAPAGALSAGCTDPASFGGRS